MKTLQKYRTAPRARITAISNKRAFSPMVIISWLLEGLAVSAAFQESSEKRSFASRQRSARVGSRVALQVDSESPLLSLEPWLDKDEPEREVSEDVSQRVLADRVEDFTSGALGCCDDAACLVFVAWSQHKHQLDKTSRARTTDYCSKRLWIFGTCFEEEKRKRWLRCCFQHDLCYCFIFESV